MQKILITGASSGIGEALALYYASSGVNLYLSGRNADRLNKVATYAESKGAKVEPTLINVSDKNSMQNWINSIDGINLVIANAGISGGALLSSKSNQQTYDIFDVNLYGVLNTILPAIDKMRKNSNGQIAIISSLAGLRGLPSAPAYSASKAAVKAYGEAMRPVLAELGIKLNVVCPGYVQSRITDSNKFYMPGFMEADKAARIIARGLAANKAFIYFPWWFATLTRLVACIPNWLSDPIFAKLPRK